MKTKLITALAGFGLLAAASVMAQTQTNFTVLDRSQITIEGTVITASGIQQLVTSDLVGPGNTLWLVGSNYFEIITDINNVVTTNHVANRTFYVGDKSGPGTVFTNLAILPSTNHVTMINGKSVVIFDLFRLTYDNGDSNNPSNFSAAGITSATAKINKSKGTLNSKDSGEVAGAGIWNGDKALFHFSVNGKGKGVISTQ